MPTPKTEAKKLFRKTPTGQPDPRFPELLRVPVEAEPTYPGLPKMNPAMNFMDATYYRFNPTTKMVEALVTVMPNGLSVAWDICRGCSRLFVQCSCRAGVQVCRSVEWIWDQTKADMAREDWTINHPMYYGSLTKAAKDRRGERIPEWERNRSRGTVIRPSKALKPAGVGTKALVPLKTPQKPAQPQSGRKPLVPKVEQVDLTTLDMAAINKAAAVQATDLISKTREVLAARKPLAPRKGLPKKKGS